MGGQKNGNFPLLYVMKMSLQWRWVVQKSLKSPLRNIKMAPYIMTFSLHKVRENCHFLDHPPTPMSLRNIKMAPYATEKVFFFFKKSQKCVLDYNVEFANLAKKKPIL